MTSDHPSGIGDEDFMLPGRGSCSPRVPRIQARLRAERADEIRTEFGFGFCSAQGLKHVVGDSHTA
jgi:hypothetical protein